MNGANDTLSLDDIKNFTRKQLDRLIAGDLYMSAGLEEGDILNLAPTEHTDKRKKNRLSKEFSHFCHSMLSTTMENESIFPTKKPKQKKKFLKNAFMSHQ